MGVYENDFITECCNKDNQQHGLFRQVYSSSLVFKLYKNDVKLALVQFDKNLRELKREDTSNLLANINSDTIKR